ncbi:MAG TPA: amidase [Acetobacteraceae bacterium]|nr:amidase [Acetobacteraceae bacterium]
MSADIAWLPAVELAEMIRTKRLSPVEVTDAALARIERYNPRLNAFAHLAADAARAEARKAEAALADNGPLGPLHGVPVTIKDLAAVRGMPLESGSPMMQGTMPAEDAVFVARLRAAGAIILGKTTTSEYGWKGVSQSPLTGITHNPWKHGYNAGASSAGAGAAAAAGLGWLHQGSDGAGSIRMPSHFCGVFGLKPSFGRVPLNPVSTGDYTAHNGPMTRTVADAALMMSVMAGPNSLDHTSLEAWPADYQRRLRAGVRGKRIAFSPDLGHARVDPEVASLVRRAAERFGELGATVEQVTPPWGAQGPELIRLFWPAHLARLASKLPEWESRMDPGLVACVREGARVTMEQYMLARERKHAYIAAIHRWFADWDFLLTPSVSVAAFPAEMLSPAHWPQHEWDWVQWAEFSYPFNMSWNPAASVPCGFTEAGLPVGLQIVGRRFDDLGVLQASAAFEEAAPWADRKPALD